MLFQRWKKWGRRKLWLFQSSRWNRHQFNRVWGASFFFFYWCSLRRRHWCLAITLTLSTFWNTWKARPPAWCTALDRVGTSAKHNRFLFSSFLQDRFFSFSSSSLYMQHFFFSLASAGVGFWHVDSHRFSWQVFLNHLLLCVDDIGNFFPCLPLHTHTCVTTSTWRVSKWPSPWQRQTHCSIPNLWILIETFEFGNVLILCRP